MCEFKIQELALLNYRRFENEKFTLNPRMNVFAGKNGSGKTTVLEAANVMLGAYQVPTNVVLTLLSLNIRIQTLMTCPICRMTRHGKKR